MSRKTSQLQIRVSPEQKGALRRLAADAGIPVSEYVLAKVFPSTQLEFNRYAMALRSAASHSKALSELRLFLSALSREHFSAAVEDADVADLPPLLRNYVAATVEQEAWRKRLEPPAWVRSVQSLDRPHFAWELRSLRPHLMRVTPLAFKRRNVFIAALGDKRR